MDFTYFVIGAGSIGRRHFDNLKRLGRDTRLIPWRKFDALHFQKSLEEKRGCAAVIISTNTNIRFELISLCVENRTPMYIEKPVAYTLDTVEKIYDMIPDEMQKRTVIGFMMRYHPAVDFMLSNKPEKPFRSTFVVGHDVNQWRHNWRFSKSYASDPDGGGVLLDLCHEIDLACLFAPDLKIEDVICLEHPDYMGVDIVSSIAAYSEHLGVCSISMDYLAPKLIRRGRLEGADETLKYNLEDDTVCFSAADAISRREFTIERNQLFVGLMRDFIGLAENTDHRSNPLCPRMDLLRASCSTIAKAWHSRRFVGQIGAQLT